MVDEPVDWLRRETGMNGTDCVIVGGGDHEDLILVRDGDGVVYGRGVFLVGCWCGV